MNPVELGSVYRLRWLIEFLFREFKQTMDWGRSLTADKHALFALSYAAFFAHALVRSMRIAAALKHDVPLESLRPLASLHVLRAFASDLLSVLNDCDDPGQHRFFDHLTHTLFLLAYEPKTSTSRPRLAALLGAPGG